MLRLPTGKVTFLFTDIEGSTALWERRPLEMPDVIARHDALLRQAVEAAGGHVFKTMGDAICAAFANAGDAVRAAVDGQRLLAVEFNGSVDSKPEHASDTDAASSEQAAASQPIQEPIVLRVRMAVHTGAAAERDGDYFGGPVNRVARLLSITHGGQVILSSACAAQASNLPPEIELRDLGHHRLKDLLEPEGAHQVCHPDLPDDFPPLRSLRAYRHNLPCHATSFIGRDTEMRDIRDLLSRAHLVTIVGSGGTGKTRLSQQIAADLVDHYKDGVFLAELAPLTDPTLVANTVAACMEINEDTGRAITETLVNALRAKEVLILVDNCEHVIDEAAHLCDALIRRCPGVRILATSREPLMVYGEHTYRVPSLEWPRQKRKVQIAEAVTCSAVRLFLDRAEAAAPTFALTDDNIEAVVQICRCLDGIPLALELAAARIRAMSPEQISHRLDDRFALLTRGSRTALPRQQTLRALIDWSWDLLTEPERTLLSRLSVFAGGWTLEAAEMVCADPDSRKADGGFESFEVLDLLTQLVDRSLVQTEAGLIGPRFRLMETIRSYGSARLQESGESIEVCLRHLKWITELAMEAEAQLDGPNTQKWLDRLETEHDNIRTALGFAGITEDRLRLASAVHRFWLVRGYLTEGRGWLESALASPDIRDMALRARSLNRAGILAWKQGDLSAARPLLASSLEIWNQLGDRLGAAGVLNNLGLVDDIAGNPPVARRFYEDAATIYRAEGDRKRTGMVLANLGANLLGQRDLLAAGKAYDEYLSIAEETQDPWCEATANHNLAEVAYLRGDHDRASKLCRKSLTSIGELGDTTQVIQLLLLAARLSLMAGQPHRAVQLLAASESVRMADNLYLTAEEEFEAKAALSEARELLSEDDFSICWKEYMETPVGMAVKLALNDEASGH